nr:helix-turn-helix transcriptional regulator [Sutcliffiella horikoshii]
MKIKCRLKALLEERGIKSSFIAKKLGVTPQTVSSWSNNYHYIPMDKAYILAGLLGIKVDELYEVIEEDEK